MTTARNTITNANIAPRVFLSYARNDGEPFATQLRQRLEAEHIPLWQDRVGLEGGRDWWPQIVQALDRVEFMVMVMTPAALEAPTVHKEWRTARQKGVCAYPVKAHQGIDFARLPRWMRDIHWYDLDHEWTKFVNDLNSRCEQQRVPFMVQETFDDGILWVTLGENPDSLIGKVEDLIYILSHERPDFTGLDAATARLAELLADRDILLVIDDVWNAVHLRPFLQGGERCARLVTTRDNGVLPRVIQRIQVDAMSQDQALQLLNARLVATSPSAEESRELRQLAAKLGEWPLLLTLVNCALGERLERGQSLHDALNSINKMLERRGLTAFDAQNAHERNQAVTKTLAVSFDLLNVDDRMHYQELAIFPEDLDIPLATVQTLWRLDEIDTEDTCERLYKLSLLLRYDLATRTIRLHDVIRSYLQKAAGDELPSLHARLLDAYALKHWADLPDDEPYLWDHLAEHLVEASRLEHLQALTDLCQAFEQDIPHPYLANWHLLPDLPDPALIRTLSGHTGYVWGCAFSPSGDTLVSASSDETLKLWDVRTGEEQRTLRGHTSSVRGCAFGSSGDIIVSASEYGTLKVWDEPTGACLSTLFVSDDLNTCAFHPDGEHIVAAGAGGLYFLRWAR